MNLLDQTTHDLTRALADPNGLAQTATVTPRDGTSGTGSTFTMPVILGTQQGRQSDMVQATLVDGSAAVVRCLLATVQAGMLTSTGTSRNPAEGDLLTIAGQVWAVRSSRPAGGACLIDVQFARLVGLGGAWGAR